MTVPALINAGAGLIGGFGGAIAGGADAERDEMRLVEQQRLANMQAAMQQAAQQQAQMQQQIGTGTGIMQAMSRLPEQDRIAYAMMQRLGAGPGVQMQARDLFNPNAPQQRFQMAGNPMTGYSQGAGGRNTPGMQSFYGAAMGQLGYNQNPQGQWSAQSQPQSWQGVWNDIMKQNMHGFNNSPPWTGELMYGSLDDPYTGQRGTYGYGARNIPTDPSPVPPAGYRNRPGVGSPMPPPNTLPGYTPTGTNPFQPPAPTYNPNIPGPGMPNPPNIPIGPTPQPPVQPPAPVPQLPPTRPSLPSIPPIGLPGGGTSQPIPSLPTQPPPPPTQQPSVPVPQPRPEPSQPTQPPRPGPGWVWDTRSNRWVQKGFDLGLPTKGQA